MFVSFQHLHLPLSPSPPLLPWLLVALDMVLPSMTSPGCFYFFKFLLTSSFSSSPLNKSSIPMFSFALVCWKTSILFSSWKCFASSIDTSSCWYRSHLFPASPITMWGGAYYLRSVSHLRASSRDYLLVTSKTQIAAAASL